MDNSDLIIRKAIEVDVESIYWLLHSESIAWDMAKIRFGISGIYVIIKGIELVGAAFIRTPHNRVEIEWTAIHPMYPRKPMTNIFENAITNKLVNFNYLLQPKKLCSQT